MILAGDIGGTNTRLAFFEGREKVAERKFPSRHYPNLESIVKEFMQLENKTASKACFGIAGAVSNGKCKATNLPWIVDEVELGRLFHMKAKLLNDLETNAYGVHFLKKEDLYPLRGGDVKREGNQALIAAGTGLGEAALYWDGKEYHPCACEGGHVDFAPRNQDEAALLFYLKEKFDHVSYERVLSGPGLHNIFQFLVDTKREDFSSEVQMEMGKKDPSAVISDFGMKNKDRACMRAIDMLISIYGSEAGNVALKFMAIGGVYLSGGIAPRLLEKLKEGAFLSAFAAKGRFQQFLEKIPVHVVLNDDLGLIGAAAFIERNI